MRITFKLVHPLTDTDSRLDEICKQLNIQKADGTDSTHYQTTTIEPVLALSEANMLCLNVSSWRQTVILIPIIIAIYEVEYIHVG